MAEEEIDELVERARHGDTAACAALYDVYAPRVYRFFRFRVSSPETAEDLMQRVFVKMVETLPGYEPRGVPFGAWLFRVARNAWIDESRSHRQTVSIDRLETAPADGGDPHEYAAASIDSALVRRAVAALPADQREVIACRFFAGLTPRETGLLMGRTEGSVRVLQHRALASLRRLMPGMGGALAVDMGVSRR
jgi:RNA polymerase sigma-70 factor (ECF subfamily)